MRKFWDNSISVKCAFYVHFFPNRGAERFFANVLLGISLLRLVGHIISRSALRGVPNCKKKFEIGIQIEHL